MTEEVNGQQEQSVDEVLEQAAQALESAKTVAPPHDPHPRKNRQPKANGTADPAEPRAAKERKPREPKPPKLYPQWNEDGTPLLDEAGVQVMAETKMKKPKAPKPPKDPSLRRTGFAATCTIHLLVEDNPKRGAARERFALYREGMTIGEAKDAGVLTADFRWDVDHGLIQVNLPEGGEAAPEEEAKPVEIPAGGNEPAQPAA